MTATKQFETGWEYDSDNDTWRPPVVPGSQYHRHRLEDIPLIPAEQIISLPASKVTAGIFGAGTFTFPGQLNVAGPLIGADGQYIQSSWIELRSPGGNPGIDFTRTPGSADFSVRLINDADGVLKLNGGKLIIDTGVVDNLTVTGAGATMRLDSRDGTGLYVMYMTGGAFRWWKNGDRMVLDDNGLNILSRNYVGLSGAYGGNFAQFSHAGLWNSDGYGFMQENNGTVYISSAINTGIYIRYRNGNRLIIGNQSIECYTNLALYDNRLRTRAWNDDWHYLGWSGGHDGLYIREYGGLQFHVRDEGDSMHIFPESICQHYRFDQLGGWDTGCLRVKSAGGSAAAMLAFWNVGHNSAHLIKIWGSALECRSWDNGGWGVFRGELEDYSSMQAKTRIRNATERLPKAERKQKVRRLRTTHFNRKRGGCANCLGSGKVHTNQRVLEDGDMPGITFGDPCPDCGGLGRELMHPEDVKNEEAGWFGFISEEVAEEFPEAVYWRRRDGSADPEDLEVSGISMQALVAVLWEEVKDLEERLDSVERLPAVAINKKPGEAA